MDLKSLGNYYVWAEEKMITAIEELSDDEFTTKHEGLGRSVRELAEHLFITYASLALPPTQETWKTLTEQAQKMNKSELLENWISSTKKFAKALASETRKELEFPASEDKKINLDIDNFYLLYTDHQTYHRAQMNSLIKIHGKNGVNTDYYSFIVSQ